MREVININIGEMIVTHNDKLVTTGGIGSCLAIVIYDKVARIGGMAHAMLPQRKEGHTDPAELPDRPNGVRRNAKYVDEAIMKLISRLQVVGAKKENMVAKIVGGARMFKVLGGDGHSVGQQNIEAAHKFFKAVGIPIESEVIGGTVGRSVRFDLVNGVVEVSTKL